MTPHRSVCPVCGEAYEAGVSVCPKDAALLDISSPPNPKTERMRERTPNQLQEPDPYLGRELVGQIRIDELVGVGSMGRVYRAFQAGVDRNVAVKILHPELTSNENLVGRFLREAKVASRLSHPHVVQVLMTGQLVPTLRGESSLAEGASVHEAATRGAPSGALYIVMEYLDGQSFGSALAACDGRLPLTRALRIVLQICDAVGEAHSLGIVHRDLKPENVMLVRRGPDSDFVKVLDFGIARWSDGDAAHDTQAGLVFGTARYISPEGATGQPVGPPGDVYAIATMLYQALAGRSPFDADSASALLLQHIHEPPPPLSSDSTEAELPAALQAAIMQNLSKRPDQRSPDARAFGAALWAAAQASGIAPEELRADSLLLSAGGPSPAPSPSALERTRRLDVGSRLDAALPDSAFPQPAPPNASPGPPSEVASLVPPCAPPACRIPPTLPLPRPVLPSDDAQADAVHSPPTLVGDFQLDRIQSHWIQSHTNDVEASTLDAHLHFVDAAAPLAAARPAPQPDSELRRAVRHFWRSANASSIGLSPTAFAVLVAGCVLMGAGFASLGAYYWGLSDASVPASSMAEARDIGPLAGQAAPAAPPASQAASPAAPPSPLSAATAPPATAPAVAAPPVAAPPAPATAPPAERKLPSSHPHKPPRPDGGR